MKNNFYLRVLIILLLKLIFANNILSIDDTNRLDVAKNDRAVAASSSTTRTTPTTRTSTTTRRTSTTRTSTTARPTSTTRTSTTTRRTSTTARPTTTTTRTSTTTRLATTSLFIQSVNDSLNLNPSNCGRRPLKQLKIVGGNQTIVGDWGWQVALYYNGFFSCGGSIINSQWVITAAHCVENLVASNFRIVLGVNNINNPEKWSLSRNVSSAIVHQFYDPSTVMNDIALLKLGEPITYNNYIVPVCIPKESSSFVGKKSWATGWGTTSYGGSISNILLEVSMPWLTDTRCLQKYPDVNTTLSICAGEKGDSKDTCQGDSGGPLVVQGADSLWYLGGITSWGDGCSDGGVYTRTSYYYNWILEKIRKNPLDDFATTKIASLLPYGTENGDISLPIVDDDSFGPISLDRTLYFGANSISSIYICSNGFISSQSTTLYLFPDINLINFPAIGSVFSDFRNFGSSSLFYRQITTTSVLNQLKNEITAVYPSKYSSLTLNWALVITWKDVSAYSFESSKSTFQLVIATGDNCQNFAFFHYEKMALPGNSDFIAGYTLGDFINYKSLSSIVSEFLSTPSYLPRSIIYRLNASPNCP